MHEKLETQERSIADLKKNMFVEPILAQCQSATDHFPQQDDAQ